MLLLGFIDDLTCKFMLLLGFRRWVC